ncbi:hypothetical protein FQA39_LY03289 [Lamprigera yunnana]|nr:hypothetical protein FQA39_LY03289 [Lamprigera yunnana]
MNQIVFNSVNISLRKSFFIAIRSFSTTFEEVPIKKRLVPSKPTLSKIDPSKLPPRTQITEETIAHLERLSLVDCANKKGIETLEDAIAFADQILQVDTKGVQPLVTVLEDRPLRVREDEVTEGNCIKDIIANATITEDEYFIAPPDLSERQGFLKRVNEKLLVGPIGALLQENLKNEWINSMVVNRDTSIFLCKDSFLHTYEYAKEVCQQKLPFGIAQITTSCTEVFDFDSHFQSPPTILQTTMFLSPLSSTQVFHQWQRQRRTWWKKFSASPGKYVFSDVHTDVDDNDRLEIRVEYPWEKPLIESLGFYKNKHPHLEFGDLQNRDGRKKVNAHFLTSTISLSSMLLNTICDAYDEPEFQGKTRSLLRFHRKVAPYKISFAISSSLANVMEELGLLAVYLCRQLRAENISSLLLPSAVKSSLDLQWSHYDQLGVPYTVVLNEATLRNGICLLRSRDTTLKEQVHVTKLLTYVQQLFKNY